jgi:hypothetical protein
VGLFFSLFLQMKKTTTLFFYEQQIQIFPPRCGTAVHGAGAAK